MSYNKTEDYCSTGKPQEKDGVRTFTTGATRTAEGDKFDYEGFLSPAVIERFGQYMHKHRLQADGSLRASDNWQKGMPISAYIKSLFRHFVTSWMLHRRYWQPSLPGVTPGIGATVYIEQEDNLCAILFNAQGALHEILKQKAIDQSTTAARLSKLLKLEQEILSCKQEDRDGSLSFAVAAAQACCPSLLEKLYQFEGSIYRESGEVRPPRYDEVYVSTVSCMTDKPVRACSNHDFDSLHKILIPYKK